MSTANRIIEKADAIRNVDEKPKEDRKRQGAWADREEFVDPASNLGLVIRERIRGRPAYSVSVVHFDDRGPNRYIPYPLQGLQRPMHEVLYLLMKQAEEWMAAHPLSGSRPRERPGEGPKKPQSNPKPKTQGGLGSISKAEAQAQGHEHIGATERKRKKKTG